MSIVKAVFRWLAGKALLYGLLVLAMLASAALLPWAQSEWAAVNQHRDLASRLQRAQQEINGIADRAEAQSVEELDRALSAARTERAELTAQAAGRGRVAQALSAATGDTSALLADGGRALQLPLVEQRINVLEAARTRLIQRDALAGFEAQLRRATAETFARWPACHAAAQDLRAFEARWGVLATMGLYARREHADLQGKAAYHCDRWRAVDRERIALIAARDGAARLRQDAEATLRSGVRAFEARIAQERAADAGSVLGRARGVAERHGLTAILWSAAGALLLIVITPFLVRLVCYFVLAPIAMRRPAIRVARNGETGGLIVSPERSSASVAVRLEEGEELLVRDGYLQTTSDAGGKGTQWFLDARHPITSLATGLTFLTRIRGPGEVTTVSAMHDPFAEVTVLVLPAGAACVLQPRALAAVAQPIARRLRITSRWRLLSLNAWLTLQLRYLVFHGPVRLVLKGGRGVRVERAERGRILGQRQVVGFSVDLAYSVTRNETFWPYLLGREPLLRDRVAAGDGVLIVEEAPMTGRRPGDVRHGLEGLIDAGMKVFGL